MRARIYLCVRVCVCAVHIITIYIHTNIYILKYPNREGLPSPRGKRMTRRPTRPYISVCTHLTSSGIRPRYIHAVYIMHRSAENINITLVQFAKNL